MRLYMATTALGISAVTTCTRRLFYTPYAFSGLSSTSWFVIRDCIRYYPSFSGISTSTIPCNIDDKLFLNFYLRKLTGNVIKQSSNLQTLFLNMNLKKNHNHLQQMPLSFLEKNKNMEENITTREKLIKTKNNMHNYSFPLKNRDITKCAIRTRFAPSPTGSLHLGGARTALYNWLCAQKNRHGFPENDKGSFILRIEDTDIERSTKESEMSVLSDLIWLGLIWDEGPGNNLSPFGPHRQSERLGLYNKVANDLMSKEKAYHCFCTKEELSDMKIRQEKKGQPPRYDGTWRDADPELVRQKLEDGVPYTVRFRIPEGARVVIDDAVRGTVAWDADFTIGDFVLIRSNGIPVYNFCVAVDDATMGITTVIRAEEHLTNTLKQGLLLDALGAARPRYAHCSLILGADGKKLSKRHGATSCHQFQLDGYLPEAMINYLALLGWNDGTNKEIYSRNELINAFSIDRLIRSPSIFDIDKLRWFNSQHIKRMSIEDLVDLVKDQMDTLGFFRSEDNDKRHMVAFAATSLAKQMMETTRDAATNVQTVLSYNLPNSFHNVQMDLNARDMIEQGYFYIVAKSLLKSVEEGLFPMPDIDNPLASFINSKKKEIKKSNDAGEGESFSFTHAYDIFMKRLTNKLNIKGKDLFHPVRLALTGEMSGQDVKKQLALLSLVSVYDSVVDMKRIGVVTFNSRVTRLKHFCASIPIEFRSPVKQINVTSSFQTQHSDMNMININSPKMYSCTQQYKPLARYKGITITSLDIRVGRIVKVWEHPDTDGLFSKEIDIGQNNSRKIVSVIGPYMSSEELLGRLILVLCNLEEESLMGISSHGIVLRVINSDGTIIKFVSPPVDAMVGERITVPGFDCTGLNGVRIIESQMWDKNNFENLAPFFVTNTYGVPEFLGRPLMTSAGVCTSPIAGGTISAE